MSIHDGSVAKGDSLIATVIIAAGVLLTVVAAIMLSLSDSRQVRLSPPDGPTIVAELAIATSIPPTAPLPTSAPTVTPTSTPQPAPTIGEQVSPATTSTAVAVLAETTCGYVPTGWVLYVVQPGDSYLKLSATSGATPNEIAQANCMDLNAPLTGSQLYLPPAPPERPQCGPPIWWARYVVRRGDTLFSLARRHGTTVFAIMQANCLENSRIFAGRSLFLPPAIVLPTSFPTATSTATPSPSPTPTTAPSATTLPTSSATPTARPLATLTSTATVAASPSPSETPTATSSSPTASATMAPTATPSPTTAATATNTPTPQPTDTPLPTATETPLPAPTSTPTEPATSTFTPIPADTITPAAR